MTTNLRSNGIAAMARYCQEHPEEWKRKMSEGKQRAKALRLAKMLPLQTNRHELTIAIARHERGAYVRGTSRTMRLLNCPLDERELFEAIEAHVQHLRLAKAGVAHAKPKSLQVVW